MTRQVKERRLTAESVLTMEDVGLVEVIPAIVIDDSIFESDQDETELDLADLPSLDEYKQYTNGNHNVEICYDDLITEDDEPVDNMPSEKLQRLLVNTLRDSNHLPRPFIAAANVGVFDDTHRPAIVPDMFLSLGIEVEGDIWEKENRSYFTWKYGKPPEIVLEVVSNTKGNEAGTKFGRYAALGVKYYAIVDYGKRVQDKTLKVYELDGGEYVLRHDNHLPDVNLSLTFWDGEFEDTWAPWVRWCTLEGELLLTGAELRDIERARAEKAEERAAQAEEKAALYLQKLREAGIEI